MGLVWNIYLSPQHDHPYIGLQASRWNLVLAFNPPQCYLGQGQPADKSRQKCGCRKNPASGRWPPPRQQQRQQQQQNRPCERLYKCGKKL